MPDEVDEMPRLFGFLGLSGSPRWHAGQAHAVLDDVEQLAIGERLRGRLAHIRWSWIQAETDLGLAAAVVGMARGAMIGIMRHTCGDDLRRCADWILARAGSSWDGKSPHRPRDRGFKRSGFGTRADPARADPDESHDEQ